MQFGFSIAMGDLILLGHGWYVTHTGLIRIARYNRCAGIHVRPVPEFSDPRGQRWAFEATAYKSRTCRGFVGYGDADPSNVTDLVRGAEMRVAETRAVNRALRKAYGIGICSVEEVGMAATSREKIPLQNENGHVKATAATVRDRLCQIIRHHRVDPNLVKTYASDFCRVTTLREATREQVENFVVHLADWPRRIATVALPAKQLSSSKGRCGMKR